MNRWNGIGRLTKEPELKLTANQVQYCNFTLAVDRKFKDASGNKQADFIPCIAWKHTAVFIQKYFHKGNKIGVSGNIQTRNYEDENGQKRFVTEVVVDEVEFVESQQSQPQPQAQPAPETEQFEPNVTIEDGELPFDI